MRGLIDRRMFLRGFFTGRATPLAEVDRILDLLIPCDTGVPLMRVGEAHDGGYLVPDDMAGISMLFSPGVAETWTFEQDLLGRYGIHPVLCDRAADIHGCPFPVDDHWLGPATGPGLMSLDDWVAAHSGGDSELMLQMDIEGAEYMTLLATPRRTLNRFRVIVVEFHDLHRVADLHTATNLIAPTLEMLRTMFVPVHVHANNQCPVDARTGFDIPRVLEVTYLRSDRCRHIRPGIPLPHALDAPNVPTLPDISLSGRWSCPSTEPVVAT